MLFSDDLVFVHSPKTGGMSCANFLLRRMRAPLYNCHANAEDECRKLPRADVVPVTEVNRHCTLAQADRHIQRISGTGIAQRPLLLAVIRHPYGLEYSFYRHLRKPKVIRRRAQSASLQLELAQGDFKTFVARAGYHRADMRQEDYFLVNGALPANLHLIRFETMADALPALVAPYLNPGAPGTLPHRNASEGSTAELRALLDAETRELIRHKHPWLFQRGYYSDGDF